MQNNPAVTVRDIPSRALGNNRIVKQHYGRVHSVVDLLPKDLPLRRSARLRERAESLALLGAIAAFWVLVFTLNFFVGAYSTPMIR
jgi:hypothetical protein